MRKIRTDRKDPMIDTRKLSLYQCAEMMRRERLGAEELLEACLARVDAREDTVQAWAALYREQALELARQRDREAKRHQWAGPLHGLPLGIKDIFDVAGMETRAGSDAYPPRMATEDAESVARLREAGGIILGKTVTTAFAMGDPNKTRNPWNPAHTPGGSSSGSGAGVADGMCLGALGTQTGGSVVRPASYNGVIGFKPGHGEISVEGVLPLAWQLDHVGTLTRTVEDAHMLWHLLRTNQTLEWQSSREKMPPALLPRQPQRVWRLREVFEDQAHPEMNDAVESVCQTLAARGVEIVERNLPSAFAGMAEAHHIIMAAEAATVHARAFGLDPDAYPPNISRLIREGQEFGATDYVGALRHRIRLISQMNAALSDVDCILMPGAPGPAPEGLESTGNPFFNVMSSLCGLPAVGFPAALGTGNLPLGVQVIGRVGGEDELLGFAGWCESAVSFPHLPGD